MSGSSLWIRRLDPCLAQWECVLLLRRCNMYGLIVLVVIVLVVLVGIFLFIRMGVAIICRGDKPRTHVVICKSDKEIEQRRGIGIQ